MNKLDEKINLCDLLSRMQEGVMYPEAKAGDRVPGRHFAPLREAAFNLLKSAPLRLCVRQFLIF